MKKLNKMVLFAVLGMMQIVSCAKNGGQSTENSPSGGTQETVQSDVKQESASGSENTAGVSGVIYVNNAGLYTENDEGKMKWAAEAALGDKALYLGEKKRSRKNRRSEADIFSY